MRLLVVTNLFGFPWDTSRGMFNQQQFDRLASRVELSVLVAVPWTEALRRPVAYWNARRDGRERWPYVDYFLFWYIPRVAQWLHPTLFFLSLLVQRPLVMLFARRDALLGSWGFPDAVATAAFASITGTPHWMKVHGTDVNEYLDVKGKRAQILAAARRSRGVFTPSRALRSRLVDAGIKPECVEVLYNGVEQRLFHPASRLEARAKLGIEGRARAVLYVGNLKVAKGCVDLVDAFLTVAAREPEVVLVVVGAGEARDEMVRRVAGARLQHRVRFVGKVEHRMLADWFVASDLLCLPSHAEGVPNVVLEAMACGVPIVATRVGGIPEVVPEWAGLLVAPRNGPALSEALRTALNTTWDSARIAAHGQTFTWESNVERLLSLLDLSAHARTTKVRP